MKYILCFGNPYIKEDSLVINLAEELKLVGYKIIKCTSPDEIMFYADKDVIILDVAKNIKNPIIITNPDQLNSIKITSLHDFDLNFFLKVYKELGNRVRVLAIPMDYTKKKLKKEIKDILEKI